METLLARGAEGDVAEAEAAIERLAAAPADDGWRSAKSGCCGYGRCWPGPTATDCSTRHLNRYREMAKSLGFEGHIDWAEAMVEAE